MSDSLKHNFEAIVWHDKRVRDRGGVRAVITSNACGSSVCWRQGLRSRPPQRKFEIDYHALRRHWRNHVSAEARAAYLAGAGASKDQLEAIVADESLALIDHYRIVRGALYKGLSAAAELGDGNTVGLLAGRLHENFRDCGRLTGELQHGPLLNIQNNVLITADYTRAIARIVSAVAPYAEAREAVVAALRDLDAASASSPLDRGGEVANG